MAPTYPADDQSHAAGGLVSIAALPRTAYFASRTKSDRKYVFSNPRFNAPAISH